MSSNDAQDIRFIEVSQIIITDPRPKRLGGDYRIVIKHEHGTEETISSSGSGKEITIDCKTFVQLNVENSIDIHRAKQFKRVASCTVNITAEEPKEYTVNLSGKPGIVVILKLGKKMTMAQVADARVWDANKILEKESKSAKELERVTSHVKILVDVMEVAAKFDPFPHAEAAVSIARMALEQIERIPDEYKALKGVALDCINQVKLDENVRTVFKSGIVKEPLNSAMKTVIKALEFIFHYYSQSRIGRFPLGSTIENLTSELRKQKEQIRDAFQLALGEGQLAIADGQQELIKVVRQLKPGGNEQHVPKVAQEKEGWVFVDNAAEADLLKRFLGTIEGVSDGKSPCFPDTRVSILEKLSTWARVNSPEASRLFWLYGVAGCGKSAVAASTSKALNKVNRLAGSFFCRRDEVGRRNPVLLFGHLASCLAQQSQDFKDALVGSLEKYRHLDNKDKFTFVEYALKEPLKAACAPSAPVIFLVDALDECNDSGAVASFLSDIVTETSWIKLIVTSREQPQIWKAFANPSILRHDLFADNEAEKDIIKYLHTRIVDFPDLHVYSDKLVEKAGGLFIWLHTVMEVVINSTWGREVKIRAFLEQPLFEDDKGKMAATYLSVLEQASRSSEPGRMIVRMIVGLLLATSSNTPLTISGLYAFLPPPLAKELSLNEFGELIMSLKPVLKLTPVSDGSAEETTAPQYRFFVQTHHASFLDFCEKQEIRYRTYDGAEVARSNPFWTDPITLHRNMAMGCLEIMMQGKRLIQPNEVPLGLRFNICNLDTSHKLNSEVHDLQKRIATQISPHLLYSALYWANHVLKSSLDRSTPAGCLDKIVIQEALAEFLDTTRSLFWLEVLSLTGKLTAGREALVRIAMQTETQSLTHFPKIAAEMCRFVEQCLPAISASTPHLYLSLTWLPVESTLWTAWKTEFSSASVLKDPIRQPSQFISSTPFPVRVDTFAVSPDKKYIVSGSRDGYVRLWDIHSSDIQVKERQISPDAPIDALVYTPDGSESRILCVCDGLIYELDAETLLTIGKRREIPYSNVRCMTVSQVHIAFGTENGRIIILDARTYREVLLEQAYAQTQAVDAISFSPDGTRLVYSSIEAHVCVWDVLNGLYILVDGPYQYVASVAFSSDGKNIATGSLTGKVRLRDAMSGEEIGRFEANCLVQFLTFSSFTRIICALASKSRSRSEDDDLPPSSEANRHYVIHKMHHWAEETSLQMWDIDFTRRRESQSAGHTGSANSVVFSSDGKRIVSGSNDWSVRVWDAQTGEPEKLAEMEHSNPVWFVTLSPDGNRIASGGEDNVIRIWDAHTGKSVQVLEGHTDFVSCGTYSPDGTRFMSGSNDGTMRIWDMKQKHRPKWFRRFRLLRRILHTSGKLRSGHEGLVRSVAFSPDGSCIASASDDFTIRLWDGETGKPLGDPLSGHTGDVYSVAFSPNGTILASGSDDKTVRRWDVRTRSAVGEPLHGHIGYIYSVAFSPDGAFIFSASWDSTIRCWNAITGIPVGQPLEEDHDIYIWSLAVSPDGHRVVSGFGDGGIRVWDSRSLLWEADESFVLCGLRGPDRVPNHISEDGWIRTPEGGLLL